MRERMIVNNMRGYKPGETKDMIRLNSNENSQNIDLEMDVTNYNRYPDNEATLLIEKLSDYLVIDKENIVVGNGSSEMIELILKAYLNPDDVVMSFDPTFVMYRQFTELYNGRYVGIPCKQYVCDINLLIEEAKKVNPKIIIVCNPNNPTGFLLSKTDIERVIKSVDCLVIVDEAYIEFSGNSMMNRLQTYENLVILRTFSKAWGLAAARLGYLLASEKITSVIRKVKSPYNLNAFSQNIGLKALLKPYQMRMSVKEIVMEREKVFKGLVNFNLIAYKSFANFIFFEAPLDLGEKLIEKKILIRDFRNGTFRVTIGNPTENRKFLEALVDVLDVRNEVVYETICAS